MFSPNYNSLATFVLPVSQFDQLYNLQLVTPPAMEPVAYADLAAQQKLDQTYDETLVLSYGVAGRYYVESATKLTLIAATYTAQWDIFDNCGLRLPRRPVTSVTSITYRDTTGTHTLSPSLYFVDTKAIWTTIRPVFGTVFPITDWNSNAVTVTFVAGASTDPSTVDPRAKLCICKWAANEYENREINVGKPPASLPHSFDAMLWQLTAPEV